MKKLVVISFVLGVSFMTASVLVLNHAGSEGLQQYLQDAMGSKLKIVDQKSYDEEKFRESHFSDQAELVITAHNADIEILKSEDNQLHLQYPHHEPHKIVPVVQKDKLTYEIGNFFEGGSDEEWTVIMNKKEEKFHISTGGLKFFRAYIPEQIKTVRLKTDSGTIEVANVNLNEATISSASGDIKLKDVNIVKADLNTASGNQKVSGRFDNLKVWAVSGDLRLRNTEVLKDLDANTVSGEISLTGQGSPTAQIDAKSLSGEVRIKYPEFHEIKETSAVVGHQKVKWVMRSLSGDIRVRYQDEQSSEEE